MIISSTSSRFQSVLLGSETSIGVISKKSERDRRFGWPVGTSGGITMVAMDFQSGRIGGDSASKSTRGCTRNSLPPMHFPLRAFLCGGGFEHH